MTIFINFIITVKFANNKTKCTLRYIGLLPPAMVLGYQVLLLKNAILTPLVVCVWIWHVIGQLCIDPSTRARRASPPNRVRVHPSWALGSGCTCAVRGRHAGCQAGAGRGGAVAACSFLAHSMATDPRTLARLGGGASTRLRLLNGGGAFSRVGPTHLLTQAVSGNGLGSVRG